MKKLLRIVSIKSDPNAYNSVSRRIHLAYWCYAYIAVWFVGSQFKVMIIIFGPLIALGMVAAGLTAAILSFIEWKEWPLRTMLMVLVLQILVALSHQLKLVSYGFMNVCYYSTTLILLLLCIRFALVRKHANVQDKK